MFVVYVRKRLGGISRSSKTHLWTKERWIGEISNLELSWPGRLKADWMKDLILWVCALVILYIPKECVSKCPNRKALVCVPINCTWRLFSICASLNPWCLAVRKNQKSNSPNMAKSLCVGCGESCEFVMQGVFTLGTVYHVYIEFIVSYAVCMLCCTACAVGRGLFVMRPFSNHVWKKAGCLVYPMCRKKSSLRFEIGRICNAECMYVVYSIHLCGMWPMYWRICMIGCMSYTVSCTCCTLGIVAVFCFS